MRILVGVEGSEESATVLRNAIGRAEEAGDELTIAVFAKPDKDQSIEAVERSVRSVVEAGGVDARIERLEGDPASALVERAERGEFDQLVIGGGRETPLGKRYLGGITEFVLLNADVTVRLER